MSTDQMVCVMQKETLAELRENILPFWMNRMTDYENGGFYGRIAGDNELFPQSEKGIVLNARILWTFSSAYRILKNEKYLKAADRAYNYIIDHFYDSQYGGVYWTVDYQGNPLDTKKQIYAIGFTIYGLSEYHRATGNAKALEYAIRLFDTLEQYSFDPINNGYLEALTRSWQEIGDMRLSSKDKNERKTMNTHLHVLEAYASLYRVWKDAKLKKQLTNLVEIFLQKILNEKTGHLNLFFNDEWVNKYHIMSFGHDIEASWLIHEAALLLNDPILLRKVEPIVEFIAAASDEGLTADGGLIYEMNIDTKHSDTNRHWWVQAENVVGHFNLYQYFDDEVALEKAFKAWRYIKRNLIDRVNGEWYWSVSEQGIVNRTDDKAGLWKCPYHNSRMCFEILERSEALQTITV